MSKKQAATRQEVGVQYPFQKDRAGVPHTLFEKIGPFTLKISNKGFYDLYEVRVTGDIVILNNQISHPGLSGICYALIKALNDGRISPEVFGHYRNQLN